MQYPEPISKLIDSYMRLPGIGAKTATRLAFYTIDMNKDDVTAFAKSLVAAKRICIIVPFVATLPMRIRVLFVAIKVATKARYWLLNNLKTS